MPKFTKADCASYDEMVPLIKACNVDVAKVTYWDNKTNWKEGELAADTYVKTVFASPPAEAKKLGGFDPIKRWEVNFKVVDGKITPMVFHGIKICRFVYALPATGEDDNAVGKGLKTLGWLPAAGKYTYQYLVKVPKKSVFACQLGSFKSTDNAKEIAFPIKLEYAWVKAALKVDSKGVGVEEALA